MSDSSIQGRGHSELWGLNEGRETSLGGGGEGVRAPLLGFMRSWM